jgi:hypothetical protein
MIARMTEAVRTSETSAYFNDTTRCYPRTLSMFKLPAVKTHNLTKPVLLNKKFWIATKESFKFVGTKILLP